MAEDMKALARRFYDEIMSQGKLEVIDELVADDLVEHQEMPGIPAGKAGIPVWVTAFRNAFPDLKTEILAVVSEGDEVWVHGRMTGTHKGDFMGIPATGKMISVSMFDRVRVRNGKAIEHWGVSEDLAMMTQLGVVPEMN